MEAEKLFISLRITTLEQELAFGNRDALETFWQEIMEHGTPLIEPIIEGRRDHVYGVQECNILPHRTP